MNESFTKTGMNEASFRGVIISPTGVFTGVATSTFFADALGYGDVIRKCEWCGQWGAVLTVCRGCGNTIGHAK